jgi:SAM-dependent methyltransferase
MTTWDERFRRGEYPTDPDPAALLARWVDRFPDGRALDVATGTGRNAVFLAERGYEVDALDRSRTGLEITAERARDRGVADRLNPIRADLTEYAFRADAYDVVTISFYRAVDRLPDVRDALTDGGVLFVEHHLRTTDDVDLGPSGDRYRFATNELLRACLDLTVLHYEAGRERREADRREASDRASGRTDRREGRHASREADPREAAERASGEAASRDADGKTGATARIVARNTSGQRQPYPFVPKP